MKVKKQTLQPLISQTGRAMGKKCFETRRSMFEIEILDIAIYVHLHKRKLLSPSHGLFFRQNFLSLLLDTIDTSGSIFFDILFFQHRNNKPANITKHRRETFLLHTLLHKCLSHLISFYYRQLRRSSGLGIFKSSCRLRWWEWGYLWTRKKFSWCFQYFCELSDVWKW